MEQKKIDEITSIRYVGIEPSFKMYYNMILCTFGLFGLHHLVLKDIKGFVIYYAMMLLAIVITLIGVAIIPLLVLGIIAILLLLATWYVPVLMVFYHYVDDDYFETIKNKKTWPMLNRLLLIVPKIDSNVVQSEKSIL